MPPTPTSHLSTKSFIKVGHADFTNSASTPSALAAACIRSPSRPSKPPSGLWRLKGLQSPGVQTRSFPLFCTASRREAGASCASADDTVINDNATNKYLTHMTLPSACRPGIDGLPGGGADSNAAWASDQSQSLDSQRHHRRRKGL